MFEDSCSTFSLSTDPIVTMSSSSYHIEKLIPDGSGLSHSADNHPVHIEGVIPGETVTARIHRSGKKFSVARLQSVISASDDRISPPCPHYHQCGGCTLQHMTYQRQLQEKFAILKDIFLQSSDTRLCQAIENHLPPLLPSEAESHYRQRIRLQVDKRQTPGFHKRRSHDSVAIQSCFLARPEINDCLKKLLPHPSFARLLKQAEALEILFSPDDAAISILFHYKRKPRPADRQHATDLICNLDLIRDIFFKGSGFSVTGCATISFTLPPFFPHTSKSLQLSLETGGFCQVNLDQNRKLVETVLTFSSVTDNESVLDLFCGMGNFSIALAEKARTVLGIEGQASAIRSARKNCDRADQKNCSFQKMPVHDACFELARNGKQYDCIVLDPPRQGAPGLARPLAALCRRRLVYISCDPESLRNDLEELLQHGFALKKIQPLDMFPQTHHIETVILLEKDLPQNSFEGP